MSTSFWPVVHHLPHRVVRLAGPGGDLVALPQHAATDGGAGIDRETGRVAGPVSRLIIDPGLLVEVVERPGARRLPGNRSAELLAVVFHQERVALCEPEVALDVAHARFAPDAEVDALGRGRRGLRGDVDDPAPGPRAIERRACRPLHDFHARNVVRVDFGQGAVDDDPVDNVEGVLAAPLGIQGRGPAQQHRGLATGAPAAGDDVRGNLALQLAQWIGSRDEQGGCLDPCDAERDLHLLRRLRDPRHDDRFELIHVGRKGKVQRLLPRAERDPPHGRLMADQARAQRDELPRDARRRNGDRVPPVAAAVRGQAELHDFHRRGR